MGGPKRQETQKAQTSATSAEDDDVLEQSHPTLVETGKMETGTAFTEAAIEEKTTRKIRWRNFLKASLPLLRVLQ